MQQISIVLIVKGADDMRIATELRNFAVKNYGKVLVNHPQIYIKNLKHTETGEKHEKNNNNGSNAINVNNNS